MCVCMLQIHTSCICQHDVLLWHFLPSLPVCATPHARTLAVPPYFPVQGLIKTLKDSFGFIERADAAEMVFFHFSELSPGYRDQLSVGCPVEFVVQNRQGKEVATQVKVLPPGSISFDVSWHLCLLVHAIFCVLPLFWAS